MPLTYGPPCGDDTLSRETEPDHLASTDTGELDWESWEDE